MKKQLLLLLFSLTMATWAYSQATLNCYPASGDYNTGTTDGTDFTETSLIRTTVLTDVGWARFDISDIPAGATIQSVEANFYVSLDDYAYWNAVAIDTDPLVAIAADLYTEITAGGIDIFYFKQNSGNFPEPDWWVADLGPNAVIDLQENLDNLEGWFGVGLYEYEQSGTYSITCDGWNETNQPFIEVTYLLPGAPLPAYNPNPVDEAFNIEPETDLTWDFGADTETYDLFFGTDFPPMTKVIEDEVSGVSGTYDPGTLEFQTTYYWQVVSKNSVAELETPGPIWSFTTKCDAWPVPIFENFETVVSPELPYCWTKIVDTWATWATLETNNWGGIDGSQCLYMDNSDDMEAVLICIPPQVADGITGKYLNFFSYGYAPLSIGTMSDPNDATTYTEFTSLALTNTYEEYEVFFTDYTGTDEYIAFKHGSTGTYQSIYIDHITIDIAPTCPKPSDLYFESSTLNTATVGWIENGSATTWNLEHGLKGFIPTGTPTMSSTTNPAEITGLESSSLYEFYVQADCGGGDLSYWVGPFEFVTQCEAFDVPVMENFDLLTTPEIPICWYEIEESLTGYATVNTISWNFYSEPNCINLYNSDNIDPTVILVSPVLNDPISELWLNFFAWGYSGQISIGTMSDPGDAATYTEYTIVTISNGYMDYQEYQVFFDTYSGTDQHIAIKGSYTNNWQDTYIDDIVIDHPPSCPKPEELYATGQTTTSALLGWMEMGVATMWNIEYDTAGFTPTGVGNVVADSNPFELTDLDPATAYEYYVQADCGGGDVSYWVGPLFFKTACEATVVPYFEGFEDAILPDPPICINVENVNEDDKFWYTADDNAYEGLQVIRVNWNGTLDMDDWFFSAPLDLIGDSTYIVQFFYTSNSSSYIEKLEVKWGEFPSSIAMTSDAIFKDTSINYAFTYYEGIGYFTPPSDGVYYVGWHGYSIPNQYNIYVDNILIDYAPSCLKPQDLYTSSTTTNSATLNWTENGDATLWNLEYGVEGFTPTGIPNATADSNPYELMGLDPATIYDVYIQADCGGGDASWWEGPATFETLCEAAGVTLTENFDAVISPEMPICWGDLIETTTSSPYIETNQWNSYSAPNSALMYNSGDQFAEMFLISPTLVDPINTLWINFFSATDTWSMAQGVIVGTITNPLDASTFTPVDTVYYSVGGVFEEYEVFFTNYTGSDQFIALKGMYNGTYQYCYFDDITIDHPPTCPKPSDLYANNATTNSVMLGWQENGSALYWNIEYGEPGFTPTGAPNANADSNPYELTGLDDGTIYEYYVRADCGSGDVSYWVGPHTFQTMCFPAPLPYEEGFEEFGFSFPPCMVIEDANFDGTTWYTSADNPYSGSFNMAIGYTFNNNMNDWFYSAPLDLLGGQTYNVIFYYTSNTDTYVEKLELLFGDAADSDAMVNGPFWSDENISYNMEWQEAIAQFTPDTSGIYYVGWHQYSDAGQWDLYLDDIFIEWDNSLVVLATATPDEVCEGESSQLNGSAVGGSGNYAYSWTSDPAGFTSTDPDPIVTPTETTDYILEVNDGMVSIYDTVTVTMIPLPGIPGTPSGLTYICATWGNSTYSTSGTTNATSYNWVIDPEDAGEISGNSTSVTVMWDEAFLGVANLSVAGVNDYCEGSYSDNLAITLYLPDVTLAAFDTVCVGWPAFDLTGGAPAGGEYSGTGVVDGMFDPAVAGVGTHTITYTYEDIAFCENSAEQDIVVDVCTGIDLPDELSIGIIPNPSNGLFNVFIKSNLTEKVNIKVMNNQGVEVFEELNVELTDRYQTEVDLQKYAKGLYYLYIFTNDATYIEKIIVK